MLTAFHSFGLHNSNLLLSSANIILRVGHMKSVVISKPNRRPELSPIKSNQGPQVSLLFWSIVSSSIHCVAHRCGTLDLFHPKRMPLNGRDHKRRNIPTFTILPILSQLSKERNHWSHEYMSPYMSAALPSALALPNPPTILAVALKRR